MNATNKMQKGFTRIELLVVVAIIAVIGAGVAVTYQHLDDKAKTAMEMSDCSILQKVIKHWSFINSYKLPNELDSLVGTDGKLYSQMPASSGSYTISGVDNNEKIGLYGPAGYTFKVEAAPAIVIANLANAGLTKVYKHDIDRTPANDSTFTTGLMGADVNTSSTLFTLASGDSDARTAAQAIVDAEANQPSTGTDGVTYVDAGGNTSAYVVNGTSYATTADFNTALASAQETLNAQQMDTLAFIYPGAGATMAMGRMGNQTMAMNLTYEIISNIGLKPDEVARPSEDATTAAANGRRYYLVVFGLGRFASIYSGKGVRADTPVVGKRYPQTADRYSRYLAVVKVPVTSYSGMTSSSDMPCVACVLTPNGYCQAALRDTYQSDEEKVKDND